MTAASVQFDPRAASPLAALALMVIAGVAFFWHPLAVMLFVCLAAVVAPTKDFKWLFLVTACVLFTVLNVSKQLDDDLVNYLAVQDYTSAKPFYTLFNKDELRSISGTYRLTEMGFYLPLWLVGQVIPDSRAAIAIFATLGIYVPTFLAFNRIARYENWSTGMLLTVAIFAFCAGMNFVQSSHLIRQYISSSILLYAFALLVTNRLRWGVLAALLACSIHNGTAPLVASAGISWWLFRYREGVKMRAAGIVIRSIFTLIFLTIMMSAVPLLQADYLKQEVPNIHVAHYVVVGSFYLVAHIAIQMRHMHLRSLYYARLVFVTIYLFSLLFFSLGLPLYALRYFAYLEWVYPLLVGGVLFNMFRNPALQVFCRFSVSLAAAAILVARIGTSEWIYGPGDNYLLSWDFFQVAQLISR